MRGSLARLAPAVPSSPTPLAYAATLLRTSDSDAYWPSFFYSTAARPAYLAIRALNVELAQLNDQVSNPMVARIRYQWWRDAIKSAFDDKPLPHPLIQLLASLPQIAHLSSYHFTRLINAREEHFLNPSFNSLQDLAEYSAGTQASLLYLLLQSVQDSSSSVIAKRKGAVLPHSSPFQHTGAEHSEPALAPGKDPAKLVKEPDSLTLDHAACHLAVANTIAILLRSIPHHASRRISVIPTEIASRHQLREEALFRMGPEAPGLRESVATMVGIAQAELRTARSCFDGTTGLSKRVSPVFLSATPSRAVLDRLAHESVNFDVFNPDVQRRHWRLPFRIWADARKRTF